MPKSVPSQSASAACTTSNTTFTNFRLLPAHRDACFRLLQLPKSVESHWMALTTTSTMSSATETTASQQQDDFLSKVLQALLLLRLVQQQQHSSPNPNNATIHKSAAAAAAAASHSTTSTSPTNLITDILRARQYLLTTIETTTTNTITGNDAAVNPHGNAKNNKTTKGGGSKSADDVAAASSPAAASAPSVLQLLTRLLEQLLVQDNNNNNNSDSNNMVRDEFSFLTSSQQQACALTLQTAVHALLRAVSARADWGCLWDAAMVRYDHPKNSCSSSSSSSSCSFSSSSQVDTTTTTTTTGTSNDSIHWQVITWKLSCFLSSMTRSNNSKSSISISSRRVTLCAAMAFAVALAELQKKDVSSSSEEPKEPKKKRAKTESPIEVLIQVANANNSDKTSFSRWEQPPVMIPPERRENAEKDDDVVIVTVDQVHDMLKTLVAAVWSETLILVRQHSSHQPPQQNTTNNSGGGDPVLEMEDTYETASSSDASAIPEWIQKHVLEHLPPPTQQQEKPPGVDFVTTVLEHLSQTATVLYYKHSSYNDIPYLDLVDLVQSMDSVQALIGCESNIGSSMGAALEKEKEVPPPSSKKTRRGGGSKNNDNKQSSSSPRRAVTPPVYTEIMQANEWIVSVLYLDLVQPSRQLQSLLTGSSGNWKANMIPIVSRALHRLLEEYSNAIQSKTTAAILVDDDDGVNDSAAGAATVTIQPDTGKVFVVHQDHNMTPDKQVAKAVVALYYHALEAILYKDEKNGNTKSDVVVVSLDDPVFYRALLACCMACITTAIGATKVLQNYAPSSPSSPLTTSSNHQALLVEASIATVTTPLPFYNILRICQCNPYDFLKVVDLFCTSLTCNASRGKLQSPLPFELPRMLVREMRQTRVHVMDSLVWSRDFKFSNNNNNKETAAMGLADCIEQKRRAATKAKKKASVAATNKGASAAAASWWPPKVLVNAETDLVGENSNALAQHYPTPGRKDYNDYRSISSLMSNILQLAETRIWALCNFLGVPPLSPVQHQVWVAFCYLLRHHIEVIYDRHLDPWILCCMYGVCKSLRYKPELTFARIIDAYVVVRGQELGDVTCQRIVRHIRLTSSSSKSKKNNNNDDDDEAPIGNVILLYNKVFVRRMKDHLLKNESLKRASEVLRGSRMSVSNSSNCNPMKTEESAASSTQQEKQVELTPGPMTSPMLLVEDKSQVPSPMREAKDCGSSPAAVVAAAQPEQETPGIIVNQMHEMAEEESQTQTEATDGKNADPRENKNESSSAQTKAETAVPPPLLQNQTEEYQGKEHAQESSQMETEDTKAQEGAEEAQRTEP